MCNRRTYESKSTVIFMCGPAGSGKSTYAKRFISEGMTILSYDEASFRRGITQHPLPPQLLKEIKTELDDQLKNLLESGKDVVLDYSFWSKKMRQEYSLFVKKYGISPQIYYVQTPKAIILERIRKRNGSHPGDIILSPETASMYYNHFEPPTPDEGEIIIVDGY